MHSRDPLREQLACTLPTTPEAGSPPEPARCLAVPPTSASPARPAHTRSSRTCSAAAASAGGRQGKGSARGRERGRWWAGNSLKSNARQQQRQQPTAAAAAAAPATNGGSPRHAHGGRRRPTCRRVKEAPMRRSISCSRGGREGDASLSRLRPPPAGAQAGSALLPTNAHAKSSAAVDPASHSAPPASTSSSNQLNQPNCFTVAVLCRRQRQGREREPHLARIHRFGLVLVGQRQVVHGARHVRVDQRCPGQQG